MSKQQCTACYDFKELSDFYNNKVECKGCTLIRSKDYGKTKAGLLQRIYNNQKATSKRRGDILPDYSLKEFRKWALDSKVFHKLYDDWVVGAYDKMLVPSADRLDDYKPYTLGNLHWMSWQENKDKGGADRVSGLNIKNARAVRQYSLNGVFIKEFYSGWEATRQTGIHNGSINYCCSGKVKTAGGYLWKFAI